MKERHEVILSIAEAGAPKGRLWRKISTPFVPRVGDVVSIGSVSLSVGGIGITYGKHGDVVAVLVGLTALAPLTDGVEAMLRAEGWTDVQKVSV